ncbi:MAG TPA: DegT/DnrJ/EryC1/StrS family aminotransferase [Dehalococcoidia bacterium]|nr:DegT/DnrJ/EryC1/StrS family aminotransferase [Dehalococcoidia bacterium]
MIRIAKPLIGDEEETAVLAALHSEQLAQGQRVREFEERFAALCRTSEAVAVSSGTAALMIALAVHGLGPGDEVITTPFTFTATANAVLSTGARPVFVDVRSDDFNIDPSLIEAKITPHTRAILPVHLYGQPCDMNTITSIARKHGLFVVEDAAQAHGAGVAGKMTGSFGTGCFSFYATKNLTTGEGGMITTDDPAVAEKARRFRSHGETSRYVSQSLGYNFRMTEIHAALGLAQLRRLTERNEQRRANAAYLTEHLRGVITPEEMHGRYHVYHQYTVRVPSPDGTSTARDALAAKLKDAGIEACVYYPTPVHRQPLYLDLGYSDDLPVAEQLSREVLSLPVHPALTPDDLRTIVRAVNEATAQGGA